MSNLDMWAMKQVEALDISKKRKEQYKEVLECFSEQGHSGTSAGYVLRYLRMYLEQGYSYVKTTLNLTIDSAKKDTEDADTAVEMQCCIVKDIIQVIDLFVKYDMGEDEVYKLKRLMSWKPIVSLTGADDEWNECGGRDNVVEQNRMCSAVFRDNHDNSTAHYIEGRVYSDNGGHSWFTGNHDVVASSTPVTFPFWVPDKPEYIYVNQSATEIITDAKVLDKMNKSWYANLGRGNKQEAIERNLKTMDQLIKTKKEKMFTMPKYRGLLKHQIREIRREMLKLKMSY